MPKGGMKGGKKGKGKASTIISSKTKQPQEDERQSGSEVDISIRENALSEEEDTVFPSSQQISSKVTEAQDELIASFFEDHPAFYDLTKPEYKNRVKKNALLKEAADEMRLTREFVL